MRRTGFDLGLSLEFLVELGWACSPSLPSIAASSQPYCFGSL